MGFANGVSSLDISNGPALAAEIGGAVPQADAIATAGNATGSRLVNNLTGYAQNILTTVQGAPALLDCSGAVSLALSFAVVTGSTTPGSVTVQLSWYDSSQTFEIFQETFEVNAGINNNTTYTLIMDRTLGAYVKVAWIASTGLNAGGEIKLQSLAQTIPVDTRRVVELSSVSSGDGLLGQDTFTLAAGASSGVVVFGLTNGQIQVRCSAATAEGSFEFLWGYGGLQPFVVLAPAGQDTLITIQATNRPLTCKVTNKGSASSGFAVSAWTSNA